MGTNVIAVLDHALAPRDLIATMPSLMETISKRLDAIWETSDSFCWHWVSDSRYESARDEFSKCGFTYFESKSMMCAISAGLLELSNGDRWYHYLSDDLTAERWTATCLVVGKTVSATTALFLADGSKAADAVVEGWSLEHMLASLSSQFGEVARDRAAILREYEGEGPLAGDGYLVHSFACL